MAESTIRDVSDPRALRAIAHPLRLRILETVALSGPATATEVARQVGESPANCSWHLRQLARYGLVEEAGGGVGRQRPWRLADQANWWGNGVEEPELARAVDMTARVLLDLEYRALLDWLRRRREESPKWCAAAFFAQSVGWCTTEELAEIRDEIEEILARYRGRVARPAGSRPVRFMTWGVPVRARRSRALPARGGG